MIADVARFPARRARQLTVMMRDEYMRLLGADIHIDAADVPGMAQTEQRRVDRGVGHETSYQPELESLRPTQITEEPVLQGHGLAEYIKNFRRRMFDSASAIFWMYNDVWPCTRSWTTVDYYGRRTPAFWPVRRAMSPVTVVVTREGDTVRVYGVNEGPVRSGTLHWGLLALKGGYPREETEQVTLPANTSKLLAESDARTWDKLGIQTHVAFARLHADGQEVARDCLILPFFKEMKWSKARVNMKLVNEKAVFTSRTFAWRVCLDLDGEQALADNFFDVYPGIPTVLEWPKKFGAPKILRIGNP